MRRFIILLLILTLCLHIPVSAFEVPEFIRVGICYGSNARTAIDVYSNEGFRIGYYEGDYLVPVWETDIQSVQAGLTYGTLYISYGYETYEEANEIAEGGYVLYTGNSFYKAFPDPVEGYGAFQLAEGAMAVRSQGSAILVMNRDNMGIEGRNKISMIENISYRGGTEFRYAGDNKMTVINVVDFDSYVCGVVPREMPSSFEPEALKAQAICARNYAFMSMGNYDKYGFDVTDDINSQVYGGLSAETERTNQAVRDTSNIVLMYEDEPVQTFFFSMSGGATEACKNVWLQDIPYLRGVDDPYEDTESIKGGLWEVKLTPEEIQGCLAGWGINVGQVTHMQIDEYTPSGGVLKMTVQGTEGSYTFQKDECRNIFQLRSGMYTISVPAEEIEETVTVKVPYYDSLEETRYPLSVFEKELNKMPSMADLGALSKYEQKTVTTSVPTGENVYILSGRGFGHRLGMSQWGAQGMAQAGFTFEQILTHYYPGSYLYTQGDQ